MSQGEGPMNGDDIRKGLTSPTIQTVLIAANLVVVAAALYGAKSNQIETSTLALAALTARVDAIENRNTEHYQTLIGQIATLQAEVKNISQRLGEARLDKK